MFFFECLYSMQLFMCGSNVYHIPITIPLVNTSPSCPAHRRFNSPIILKKNILAACYALRLKHLCSTLFLYTLPKILSLCTVIFELNNADKLPSTTTTLMMMTMRATFQCIWCLSEFRELFYSKWLNKNPAIVCVNSLDV